MDNPQGRNVYVLILKEFIDNVEIFDCGIAMVPPKI
jgi:hypothetical protein